MDRKAFVLILLFMIVLLSAGALVRYYQPESRTSVDFSDFPLIAEEWQGVRETVPEFVLELLQPEQIFSGNYRNDSGGEIHLLFDFFLNRQSFGGPHSPRNCLPGGGWSIDSVREQTIELPGRTVQAGRFSLSFEQKQYLMDFWYVTNYGETFSDYKFKLYSMLSSLTFQPREVAFIRMIASDTEKGRLELERFESLFIPEIYKRLPFQR
ncbi:MAG: EpsI family protein [bacterium]|nr:EpsI family protein [bacterium]